MERKRSTTDVPSGCSREQTLERVQARGCTAGDKQGEIRANAEQYDTVADKQHDWVPNVSEKVMYPLSREEYVAKYQECYQNNFDSWLGIGAFAEGAPIWDCALGGYKPQDEQA